MSLTASAASYTITVNTSNYYGIKNLASGRYLNVYGNGNSNGTNITLWDWDGTSGVYYKFTKSGSNVVISPMCATSRAVNIYGDYAAAGYNVCLWSKTGHSTQAWTIEYVPAKNGFIFRSANNKNYVLAAAGTGNGANVYLKQYNANDNYQIWQCSGITAQVVSSSTTNPASTLKITPTAYPTGNLNIGSYYTLRGTVTSNYKITKVTGDIYTTSGKAAQTTAYAYPNATSFSIADTSLDCGMYFNRLPAGDYFIRYTATDASGKQVTWGSASTSKFTVKAPAKDYTLYWPFTTAVGSNYVTSDARGRIDSDGHYHAGIDFSASYGSSILAVADGVVVSSGYTNARGYYVAVYHDSLKLTTVYQHMAGSSTLKAGQSVTGGKTVIGKVGSTGYSTGSHLHLEVIKTDSKASSNVEYGWRCAGNSSQLYRIVKNSQINWIKR